MLCLTGHQPGDTAPQVFWERNTPHQCSESAASSFWFQLKGEHPPPRTAPTIGLEPDGLAWRLLERMPGRPGESKEGDERRPGIFALPHIITSIKEKRHNPAGTGISPLSR